MRELTTGTNVHTTVAALDEPSFGGACHQYQIYATKSTKDGVSDISGKTLQDIYFQKGPIKKHGVNGIAEGDLLCILIDRLEGFQKGEYACKENALVLTYLQGALGRLRDRTQRREAAGIEGTSQKDPMCAEAQARVDEEQAAHFERAMAGAVKVFEGFRNTCIGCEHLTGNLKDGLSCVSGGCVHSAKVDEQKQPICEPETGKKVRPICGHDTCYHFRTGSSGERKCNLPKCAGLLTAQEAEKLGRKIMAAKHPELESDKITAGCGTKDDSKCNIYARLDCKFTYWCMSERRVICPYESEKPEPQ